MPARANPDWTATCAAVIPCFNEAMALPEVLARLRKFLPHVFVVDDGSTDSTSRVAEAAGARVLRHASNQGKGRALQTGFAAVQQNGFEWALVIDGDGQHAPEDVPKFFACAERSGALLVAGNRLGEPGKIPPVRRFINRLMTKLLSWSSGRPLADSQCGFRLIHLGTLARVPLRTDHFETESEVLVRWARAGFSVEFVPVQVIYRHNQSKIHPLVDTWRWLRWWLGGR